MENKKKSILFVSFGLGIGGVEKCLVNLLNALPEDEYDIDVLLMNAQYDMKPQVQDHVNFLDEFSYVVLDIRTILREMRNRGGYFRHMDKLLRYTIYRIADKLNMKPWRVHGRLPKHYDIAVAYAHNGESIYYVMDRVKADRKVMWYHNSVYKKTGKDQERDQEYYPRFDYIVPVSQACKIELQKKLVLPEEKMVVLRNLCNADEIQEKASAIQPEWGAGIHIVTVGRLIESKGPELALEALESLRKKDWNIFWHWIGDGPYASIFREMIKEKAMEEFFLLEGNQNNPYPYILRGDIYVQPSWDEAYSTTVTEAKVLCRPMVVTDVGGMRDQLKDGENALIVAVNSEQITDAVECLLKQPDLRILFTQRLKTEDFSPQKSLEEYKETVFGEQ